MSYEYRYRPIGTTEWIHQWTNRVAATICDLEVNQTYQYEVRAYCGNDRKSDFSSHLFTTDSETTTCEVGEATDSCTIQNLEILNHRKCYDNGTIDPRDDYFYADVVVYFDEAPTSGDLILTGNTTATVAASELTTNGSYRFNRLKLTENNSLIDLTAAFTANETCQFNINYPIPSNPCWQGRSKNEPIEPMLTQSIDPAPIELSVYPNPASVILQVTFPALAEGEFVIYNILGKKMSQQKITTDTKRWSVDLTSFEKGIYQLVLQTKQGIQSQQFIKQ